MRRLTRAVRDTIRRRDAFALPLVILVIATLTVTLAAAFSMVTAEIATNSAQRSESRAFALAESGLEEYLAHRSYHCTARAGYAPSCGTMPQVDSEYNIRINLEGGYADVFVRRVQRGIGLIRPAVYLVRSRGVDTISPFNGATRGVFGERIVAEYVQWNSRSINILSGWTSLNGLVKNGGSGTMGGADHCSAASGGGAPSVAGVAVPTSPGMGGSGAGVPTGSPPVANLGTQAAADSAVKIDWNGIVSGTTIAADYTFAYNAATPAALITAWADPNYYPVVHVTGGTAGTSWTIPNGQGLLIIDGNATMSGSTVWNGVIMAGGNFTSNGTTSVYGAILSALNMKLTATQLTTLGLFTPTSPGSVGNGTKDMEFDSCQVAKAAGRLGNFTVLPNAWMDNYTTY